MARWRWLLGALLVLHVAGAARVAFATDWGRVTLISGDNARYREIAHAGGLPYRDHDVEFPPVSWLAVDAIGAGSSATVSGRALVALQLACDVVVAAALAWGWTTRAAVAWLALLVPLLWDGWIFARIDLVSVALAVAGLAAARRRHARSGGVLVGLGVLAKLWPAAVAPALLIERRRTALGWAATVTAVGAALWWIVGGRAGLRQVTTFRGATGWQVESSIGSLLHLVDHGDLRGEAGAVRIGTQPGWSRPLLALALVGAVTAIWWVAERARRRTGADDLDVARAAVAAVAVTLVLAPIISPQYVVWLVPFVALAIGDRVVATIGVAVVVLTAVVVAHYDELLEGDGRLTGALVARNALLVAIAVAALVPLTRRGRTA